MIGKVGIVGAFNADIAPARGMVFIRRYPLDSFFFDMDKDSAL
jgi:hypothetical protein